MESDTVNVKGLDLLLKALKVSKPPSARVGILGDKNKPHFVSAKAGQKLPNHIPTNAEIGAVHEFGSPKRGIPPRSFLRIPISEKLQKYMEDAGAFDEDVFAKVIKTGSVLPWLKKIAILGEAIVSDAFDSAGFGKWKGWKNPNYTNQTNQILVDTQQLRNSITSEVKE